MTTGSLYVTVSIKTYPFKRREVPTISTMGVDSLEEAEDDPYVDSYDVQVLREEHVQKRAKDRARTKDEDLSRMGVFCCKAERRRVPVVDFVNVLVQNTCMERLVGYTITMVN